jgi:WD40 repeat protein
MQVKEEFAGKKARCPRCQAVVVVPGPPEEIPEVGAIEVLDDDEEGGFYGFNAEDAKLPDRLPGADEGRATVAGGLGVLSLGQQAEPAACLALHADSRIGLAGCGETIFILDLSDGKRSFRFEKHRAPVTCLGVARDGLSALSGDDRGRLLHWDVAHRKAIRWLEGHRGAIRSVALAPNGRFAVTGGDDGVTRLWELDSGKEFELFEARWRDPVECVAFSPDGRSVLAAGEKVRTWSVKTGEPALRFKCDDLVTSVAYSHDGAEIAACTPSSRSRTGIFVQRWDADTGKRLPSFENPSSIGSAITLAMIAPGSLRVVSMGKKANVQGRSSIGSGRGGGVGVGAIVGAGLAAGFVGAMLAGGGGGGGCDGGDSGGGCVVVFVPGSAAFDPSDPYCMQVWGLVTGSATSFDAGKQPAVALAISADGSRALSAGRNNIIQYWGLPR